MEKKEGRIKKLERPLCGLDKERWQSGQHRPVPQERGPADAAVKTQVNNCVHSFKFSSSPYSASSDFKLLNSSEKKSPSFTCLYTNADRLMNKRSELKAYIDIYQPDIIGITEVKPKTERYVIQDCELSLDMYDMFHNLQNSSEEDRGVVLYVKSSLKASLCDDFRTVFAENVIVECTQNDGEKLFVGLIYKRTKGTNENTANLNNLLTEFSDHGAKNKLLMGDFNFPEIDWNTEICETSKNHPAAKFLKATKDAFLIQNQKLPTRYRKGQKENVIDLVFTNSEDMLNEISVIPGLGKSDHHCLIIELSLIPSNTDASLKRNFRKTDIVILKQVLGQHDWNSELDGKDVNETWSIIKANINAAIEESTPLTKVHSHKGKPWMNKETLDIVREKHRLFRKWQSTRNPKDETDYKKANNRARRECRRADKNKEKKVAEEAKENPNGFWRFVNAKLKVKSGIADLKKDDGSKTTTDEEKAELLNRFFQSVFTSEDQGPLPKFTEYDYESSLENIDINEDKVRKLLKDLKVNKAAGPDGIPASILSYASEELAKPLSVLFCRSLDEGQLPEDWKLAYVTPIFKKGSKSSVNNYRPVSLTSIVCKTLEKIVREEMIKHLINNNLISEHQHGFVPGRSCTTQLLEAMDQWTNILDDNGSIDIVYMDYMKAFDSVPHRRLLLKLSSSGVKANVLSWVKDFLSNRKQRVVINGVKSSEANVTSGIPQGSVLGPLLFVIYINDLPRDLKTNAKMFADDTKLYVRSDTDTGPQDLQDDLDTLQDWSEKWLLRFHPQKCGVMKLGKASKQEYYMGQPVIPNDNSTRTKLGVINK